ncbi:hypothetical protein ACFY1V_13120 [Streptomyces sp. NPDC001255]|uniref:hypothetical protein n=1 Tax=Streptomyces sp. NPDC001255 TaxID=3364550 RepID=UPI003696C1B6
MSNPAAPAEQLLELAAEYRRHNDALMGLWETIAEAPTVCAEKAEHARRLAVSAARVIHMIEDEHPRNTRPIQVVRARAAHLRQLALDAAHHLDDASTILAAASSETRIRGRDMSPALRQALERARNHIDLAKALTTLGPSDCVATAEIYVTERRRTGIFPLHRPPALSPSQDAALRAVARGQVATHDSSTDYDGTEIPERAIGLEGARVTITTIRSLESRGLVTRAPSSLMYHDSHVFLTPDGRRGLAASFGLSRPPATTPARPAPRPTTTRSTTR